MNQHYHTSFEDLLVKYMLQEAGPEEIRTVEQWLAADPANRHYYDQVRLIWEKSLRLTPDNDIPEIPGEEEAAWQTLREKLHEKASHRTPVRRLHRTVIAVAAVFLLAALVPFLWWQQINSNAEQTLTAQNAIRTDTLPDGSVITLNKNSSLKLPHNFKEREIGLQGEAFFRVATDKDRPFHVHTNGITITVLGTSFNVRAGDSNKTTILVESGRISVQNEFGNIQLDSGETITLTPRDHILQKQIAASPLYKYYQPRIFVCHDTPLGTLVDALNKAYGDSIVIENPALKTLPITTTFHDATLADVLDVIKKTLNINVHYSGTRYILQ